MQVGIDKIGFLRQISMSIWLIWHMQETKILTNS